MLLADNMRKRCVLLVLYLILVAIVISMVIYLTTTPTGNETVISWTAGVPASSVEENQIHTHSLSAGDGESLSLLQLLQDGYFTRPPATTNVALGSHNTQHRPSNVVQHSRHMSLSSACLGPAQNSTPSNWRVLSDHERQSVAKRIIVNDDRGILFCHTPLSGITSWLKIMYFIGRGHIHGDISHVTNKDVINDRNNFVYLDSFSLKEQEDRLHTYLSFMVAQHPLLRVATTYRHKFMMESDTFFRERFESEIIKKYRKKGREIGRVQFQEFVQYLVEFEDQSQMNEHWQPLEKLCRPCEINYDVILHHETMPQDSKVLLRAAKLTGVISDLEEPLLVASDHRDQVVSVSYAHQLFSEVSHHTLLWRLVGQYSNDLDMFSYSTLLPWQQH